MSLLLLAQLLTSSVALLGAPPREASTTQATRAGAKLHSWAIRRLPKPGHQSWAQDLQTSGSWSAVSCACPLEPAVHTAATKALPDHIQGECDLGSGSGMRPCDINDCDGSSRGYICSSAANRTIGPTNFYEDDSRSCAVEGLKMVRAPCAGLRASRRSRRSTVRWKGDDEAAVARSGEVDPGPNYTDDALERPHAGPLHFTPSVPEEVHYDPHRDHRDRDHAALGEKQLNAAQKDYERLVKQRMHKNVKRMKERIHDSVRRPEL